MLIYNIIEQTYPERRDQWPFSLRPHSKYKHKDDMSDINAKYY